MSVSNGIRSAVQQEIDKHVNASSTKGDKAFPTLRKKGAEPMLKAVASVYRSQKNPNHKATDEDHRIYATCLNRLASNKGIKPQSDGTYTNEQYQNELSPENVLTFTSNIYLQDKKPQNPDDIQKCITDIKSTIGEVYNGASEEETKEAQKVVDSGHENQKIVYMTEEEFANASEDEQEAYMETLDPADRERYQKARENKEHDPAAELKMTNKDKEWAHKSDDDDAKIQSGDIIDYLMKEVILASAEWTLNKTGGFVGTVTYELTRKGLNKLILLHREHMDADDDLLDKAYNKVKSIFHKDEKQKIQSPKDLFLYEADNVNSLFDSTYKLSQNPEPLNKPVGPKQTPIYELLVTHKYQKENSSDSIPQQNDFDKIHIDLMVEECKDKGIDRATIEREFKKFTQAQDQTTNDLDPASLMSNPDIAAAYKKTMDETIIRAALKIETQRLELQAVCFKEAYALYKMSEAYRANPEMMKEFMNDKNKKNDFTHKAHLEGLALFYQAQKDRKDNPALKIPSNDDLIQMVKKQ